MSEGSLQSALLNDVFFSNLILITICFLFVFVFVRGSRRIFSRAAVRDVEKMNSIKSLYTFISYFKMEQKERHWNSFVVAGERRSYIYFG